MDARIDHVDPDLQRAYSARLAGTPKPAPGVPDAIAVPLMRGIVLRLTCRLNDAVGAIEYTASIYRGRWPEGQMLVFAMSPADRIRIDPPTHPSNAQLWVHGTCFDLTPKAERRVRAWLDATRAAEVAA